MIDVHQPGQVEGGGGDHSSSNGVGGKTTVRLKNAQKVLMNVQKRTIKKKKVPQYNLVGLVGWWRRVELVEKTFSMYKKQQEQEKPKINMNIVEGVVEEDNKLEQDGGLPCSQGKGAQKRKYMHGEYISYDSPSKRRRTNNFKVNLMFWKKLEGPEPH